MSPWPRRLGPQLMLMAAASLGASFALFGAHTIREQSADALATIRQQAGSLARDLALLSEQFIVADKLDEIDGLLMNTMEQGQIADVRVVDREGSTISHAARAPGQPRHAVFDPPGARMALPAQPVAQFEVDTAAGHVVAWHPITSGTLRGWVRVDHDTAVLATIRDRIWRHTLVAGLLAGLGSVALLAALLRKPLRALDAAKSFATGLQHIEGQQIAAIEGPLETRELSHALNQASARLHAQRTTIEASLEQLRRQEAALADSNEQLQAIFALSPDALVAFDAEGRVRYANHAFGHLTGLDPAAVPGLTADDLDAHLRQGARDAAAYRPLATLFDDAAPAAVPLELVRPRPSVLALVGRHGRTPSVARLLYLRDITHESQIDRMKSEFLSTAAHELRTPMTSIHASIELLLARDWPPARQRQMLELANRQSRAMMSIVDELLDLARIEARGAADFQFETVALVAGVQGALADFVAPSGRSAPELSDGSGGARVSVDLGKFAQVVRNLLSNAYKYSSDGAVQVRLLADPQGPSGARAGLQVEDRGIGMTPEQLARVTERFFRADASGHVPGTGLGMSIVSDLVGLMAGTLEIASEPGRGTTVTVWLPRVMDGSPDR